MILIILSWVLFFFVFLSYGYTFSKISKIQPTDLSITILLGVFVQTILLTCCSFFFKIGAVVFTINLLLGIVLFYLYRNELITLLKDTYSNFYKFSKYTKSVLLLLFIIALKTSSDVPFLIDNESYYIQSIKWINEYGLVKGLANLHLFLGQMSPFHILQAGFNFNFISNQFNDLNGFVLVICSYYFLQEMENKRQQKRLHWIGFIVLFSILFLQFVSQPSPDLILILVSQIILYLFLEQSHTSSIFRIALLLFALIVFIKITILPLGLLFIYWSYTLKKEYAYSVVVLSVIGVLFVLKNSIITGYTLFPFPQFAFDVPWRLPEILLKRLSDVTVNAGYFESNIIPNTSISTKLNSWILLGGLNRIFNNGILLLFIAIPFTSNFKKFKLVRIAYAVLAIHFILILLKSPQFRFFMPEFIFLSALLCGELVIVLKIRGKDVSALLLVFCTGSFILFSFLNLTPLTNNKFHQTHTEFASKQLLFPSGITKYPDMEFDTLHLKNLLFYSPKENFFFYGTANGPLPCVNKKQLKFMFKKTGYIPQQLGNEVSDGFYSLKYKRNDH
jgi:hypothetical protein